MKRVMGYVLLFILGVLAVEDVATILLTVDLLDGPRTWARAKFPKIGKIVTCRLCQSFWLSLAFGLVFPVEPFRELIPNGPADILKVLLVWLPCHGLSMMWAEARERYMNRAPDSKFVRAIVRVEKDPTGPSDADP
jgi:hypothetical protein